MIFSRTRHFRVAVTRQIDQKRVDFFDFSLVLAVLADVGAAQGEKIDVLGTEKEKGEEEKGQG